MAQEENNKRITAVVPTYNEGERIKAVLNVLTTYSFFKEIIVVDDGSTDNTAQIVQNYNVRYIKNETNQGKGHAMNKGVMAAQSDIIFFVDADVSGLTHEIIEEITDPVVRGDVDMFIGMRNRKIYNLHAILVFVPLLGGERAITKELWLMLPEYYKHRFRVEAGLNFYAKYYGKDFQYKVVKGLKQVVKEKKYGLIQGLKQRIGMVFNILSAQYRLEFVDIPKSARNRRMQALLALQSIVGMIVGILVLVVIQFGPNHFVFQFFAEKMQAGLTIPFVNYVAYLTRTTTVSILMVLGFLIFITHFFIFLLSFRKAGYFIEIITSKIKNEKI